MFFKLLSKFESLIYFFHRLNFHIQDEALHNGRILEGTLLLVFLSPLIWKFLTKYGNINKIFIQINFLHIINVKTDLFLSLSLIHQLQF